MEIDAHFLRKMWIQTFKVWKMYPYNKVNNRPTLFTYDRTALALFNIYTFKKFTIFNIISSYHGSGEVGWRAVFLFRVGVEPEGFTQEWKCS